MTTSNPVCPPSNCNDYDADVSLAISADVCLGINLGDCGPLLTADLDLNVSADVDFGDISLCV